MRYVIVLRSTLRFVRCLDNPGRIAEFDSYEAAEGRACDFGTDAAILEYRRLHVV